MITALGMVDEIRNQILDIERFEPGSSIEVISDTPSTAFTAVTSDSSSDGFGSYAEVAASTSKEYMIDSICAFCSVQTALAGTCQVLRIATGASGSETVIATIHLSVASRSTYKVVNYITPKSRIVIPSGSRIAIAIADNHTSAIQYKIGMMFSV